MKKPFEIRRYFRFSLRAMLVLVTVFGVWLGIQVKWVRDRQVGREWIARRGYLNNSFVPAPSSALTVGTYHDLKHPNQTRGRVLSNGPTVSPYLNLLQQNPTSGMPSYRQLVRPLQSSPSRPLPWILRLLGETPLRMFMLEQRKLSEADRVYVKKLERLFPEADLVIVPEI